MARCPLNISGCSPTRQNPCPSGANSCRLNRKKFPVPGYVESRNSFQDEFLQPLIQNSRNRELSEILQEIQNDISEDTCTVSINVD
jgi:hypothetical protein